MDDELFEISFSQSIMIVNLFICIKFIDWYFLQYVMSMIFCITYDFSLNKTIK